MPKKRVEDREALRFSDAYESALGPAASVFHVKAKRQKRGTPHIDVYIWRGPRFALLVTGGMSSRVQPDPHTHRPRVELYTKVPASLSARDLVSACEILWAVAQWPFRGEQGHALAEWHMVHGLPPLAEGSALTAMLVTMPLAPDQPVTKMVEAAGAQLLHAYGMTEGEREEAERLGLDTRVDFSRALMHAAGSLTDPHRREIEREAIGESLERVRAAKPKGGQEA